MPNLHIEALKKAVEKRNPLYSIFDRVVIKKHEFNPQRRSRLDVVRLTADGLATKEGFPKLTVHDLEADLDLLKQNLRESAYAETLPFLYQKYGWRIADLQDTEKYPDAALCDSSRVAQALDNPGSGGGYLLVKGDLTGIQEYIYHGIQPGKTGGLGNLAKRLRARSILVSVLTDFIANVILRELGLSSWHLLFAGGGHFNFLLPDDKKGELDNLANSIGASLRHQFGERLELIVASEWYTKEQLEKKASRCFEAVNIKRDKLKHQQHLGGLNGLFQEKIDNSKVKQKEREERERRIGAAFPKQHFLVEIVSKNPLTYNNGDVVLAVFEIQLQASGPKLFHTLLAVENLNQDKNNKSAYWFLTKNKGNDIQFAHILALNDTNFLPKEDWKPDFEFPISFGFRFLGKHAPRPYQPNTEIEDASADLLDFNQIAEIGNEVQQKGEGFVRLGSLMLDVDNLGSIFSDGLEEANLARIITLSRELNYFFTAHFNQRAEEPQHRVYVVYSGGDDAFAVGKWDMLMRFAKVLRADFQRFIRYEESHNDDVHFSAGLFMSNPHYPVGRFYKDTKAAQDKAKDISGKDCVDVFDYTLDWTSYDDKYDLGNQFRDVLEKGQTNGGRKFNASFAYRIMQLVKSSYHERDGWENEHFVRRGKLRVDKFARNIARMHYLFARNGFSAEDSKKITDALEVRLMHSFLKNAMNSNDTKGFEARDYLVALNFAILQIRSSKSKTA